MAEAAAHCTRSLGGTLIGAVSTLAIFAASNWGLAAIVGDIDKQGFVKQTAYHIMLSFAMQVQSLYLSVWNAITVKLVKRALREDSIQLNNHRSIPIITLCPLLIRIPAADYSSEVGERYTSIDHTAVKGMCPLKLGPASVARSAQVLNGVIAHEDGSSISQCMYLQLPKTSFFNENDENFNLANDRFALLALNLAPEHQDLRYLRKRGPFQTVVTIVQAIGYVVNIIDRKVQHVDVSPLEALVAYYSLLVVIQLVIELYACGNYERPLLLCLDHDQCTRFFQSAPRKDLHSYYTQKGKIIILVFIFFSGVLGGYGCSWYRSRYRSSQPLCFVTALVFFVALNMFYCSTFIRRNDLNLDINIRAVLIINIAFILSMILAFFSTIVYWNAFKTATPSIFSWLILHL